MLAQPTAETSSRYAADPNVVFLEFAYGTGTTVSRSGEVIPGISLRQEFNTGFITYTGIKYFWSKSWGAALRMTLSDGAGHYFHNDWTDERSKSFSDFTVNFSLGVIYRKDFGRFSFQPSFGIGGSSIYFVDDLASIYRKQPGVNDADRVSFGAYDKEKKGFAVTPSVYLGFKMSPRVQLFAECSYIVNLFRAGDLEYTLIDAYTGVRKKSYRTENKRYDLLALKLGLSFQIDGKRRNRVKYVN
jgi:hypothetical protein